MRRWLALLLIAFVVVPSPAWARLLGNATAPVVMIQMVASSDHVTSFTGGAGAPTCKISKNGATFATSTNSPATVSGANGWYQFSLTTTETNTNGPLAVKCTQTAADDTDYLMEVVSFNPNASIPSATAGASGGLLIAGVNATASFTNAVWLNEGLNVSRTTAGPGVNIVTNSGDGISVTPTSGSGLVLTANGTSKHGLVSTGGTAGTSDGIKAVAGVGGKDLRAASGITVDACTGCSTAGGTTLMPSIGYVKDTINAVVDVWIKDTSTQQGKTGLTSLSTGLAFFYCRVDQGNANCQTITVATGTRGNYTSGGFVEKDATRAPGMYEFGLPTAVLASGADWVLLEYSGVSGTAPTQLKIELVDVGLLALNNRIGTPTNANVSADVAAVKQDTGSIKGKTDSMSFTGTNIGSVVNAYASGQAPLQPSTAGRTLNVASTGEAGIDWSDVANATATQTLTNTTHSAAQVVASVTGAVGSVTGAVGSVTGNLGGNVAGNVAGSVGSVTGNVGGNVAGSVNSVTSAVTLTQAVGTYRKNVASQRKQPILLRATADPKTGVTGASVTVTVSKEGAAFGATTGTVSEIANGAYAFAPSQADTNCDTCLFRATATNAVDFFFYLFTAQ